MSVTDVSHGHHHTPIRQSLSSLRLSIMARWEPGARERLQAAALELFATRGFEQVTAAEIAQSVGLTERTFFRHFSDKREVLFYGQQQFLQAFVDGVDAAPPG